jgi:inosine-uridine nucleoside N-ribohydrolase
MMNMRRSILRWFLVFVLLAVYGPLRSLAQPAAPAASQNQLVILDTDIGDDIDDAFALALVLQSPELKLLGITTTYGQTHIRARIVDRYLHAVQRTDIPIAVGTETPHPNPLTQFRYAENSPYPDRNYPSAAAFALEQIRLHPNEITLIAIGPLANVGAMIDADPSTFRKLKRVVMMGGSIYRRYGDLPFLKARGPEPEWNILRDIESARKLLASGVPVYMMPLDSTQLKLDETKREILFSHGTPLTDQLTLLYHQWGQLTPTLFDPMAVAYALDPDLCPVTPLHIRVDDQGYTRVETGTPNASVCLHSSWDRFFDMLMPRLLQSSSAK